MSYFYTSGSATVPRPVLPYTRSKDEVVSNTNKGASNGDGNFTAMASGGRKEEEEGKNNLSLGGVNGHGTTG